jgi:hypothetical protein
MTSNENGIASKTFTINVLQAANSAIGESSSSSGGSSGDRVVALLNLKVMLKQKRFHRPSSQVVAL